MQITMLIFGLLTLISAGGVVFSRKSLKSALWLVATLFFVAVHFALLSASFLASLQVMIYAGAIMVLVVFVIMLLGLDHDVESLGDIKSAGTKIPTGFSLSLVAVLFSFLFFSVINSPILEKSSKTEFISGAKEIGEVLLTKHIAGFELAAVLLLAAVVGAIALAYDTRPPLPEGRGLTAMRRKANENN